MSLLSIAHTSYQLSEALLAPVLAILSRYRDPYLQQDLVSASCVHSLSLSGNTLAIGLVFPYPCAASYPELTAKLTEMLTVLPEINDIKLECRLEVPANNVTGAQANPALKNIKHVIAVASGKGGVGKSTTAINLAIALRLQGAKVGILDADIYGPSIPIMLGLTDFTPSSNDGKMMQPAKAHGLVAQSIGFIFKDEQAAMWRGPMAAGALTQLLAETDWPELDYLVVDMPPGTGDIQLTLAQKAQVSGAVIVTTPQDIALADAEKGISLFNKVNIPVLGIVENMSFHLCQACGHKAHPFGSDGGSKIAQRYQVPLLGSLPLDMGIGQSMDEGNPCIALEPDTQVSAIYKDIAAKVGAALALAQRQTSVSISISDDE
jgi:ATP-binding protein involved in chromosome partitioning